MAHIQVWSGVMVGVIKIEAARLNGLRAESYDGHPETAIPT